MPTLATHVLVQCPRDQKEVDVKTVCNDPPCQFFRHFAYHGIKMYVECGFNQKPGREEAAAEPTNPELDEAEEESLEVYSEPR